MNFHGRVLFLPKTSEKLYLYLYKSECLDTVQKCYENPSNFILKRFQRSLFMLMIKGVFKSWKKGQRRITASTPGPGLVMGEWL